MKNPGIVLQEIHGQQRKLVVYNNQPLLKKNKKIVLHLVDDNLVVQKDEAGKPKTLLRDYQLYNDDMKSGKVYKLIGYID